MPTIGKMQENLFGGFMARYRYSESDFRLIENSCLAFGVYQFLDRRVVTVALSEGLLELFGLPDRAEAYAHMANTPIPTPVSDWLSSPMPTRASFPKITGDLSTGHYRTSSKKP